MTDERDDKRHADAYPLLHPVREKWSAMCARYERANSNWHNEMPGDWPVEVVMTMDELRQLAAFTPSHALEKCVYPEECAKLKQCIRPADHDSPQPCKGNPYGTTPSATPQKTGWAIQHVDGRWRTMDTIGMPDWTDDPAKALVCRLREHTDAYATDDPEDVRIVEVSW